MVLNFVNSAFITGFIEIQNIRAELTFLNCDSKMYSLYSLGIVINMAYAPDSP